MPSLKDAHFFRRVPADVSEATKAGGVVSIAAWCTIGWLVLTQYGEYATSRHATELKLDHSSRTAMLGGGAAIRINFNLTMSHLPCQYASVHVADHVGAHEMGGLRNVHKVRVNGDGSQIGIFEPHKYSHSALDAQDKAGGMASHVFPWHKKQLTQGDATHRKQVEMKHLSAHQRDAIAQVESTIHQAGKAAHAGRRLLSVEPSVVHPADHISAGAGATGSAGQAPEQPASAEGAEGAEAMPLPDTSSSCKAWAQHGECISNAGYMLTACETSCHDYARTDPSACGQWAQGQPSSGRCADARLFMSKFCTGACKDGAGAAATEAAAPHGVASAGAGAANPKGGAGDAYTAPHPYNAGPSELSVMAFEALLRDNALVVVNFYAPWCFWSNKLTPAWTAVGQRLHRRAYSQSVKFIKVDCTTALGGALCKQQSVHAFPSVRIYRGSSHAFEPYEFGREENVLWLHLVKTAAEILVNEMTDAGDDEQMKKLYAQQISHVSEDLRLVMERRSQGLDEDWSEDALSAEEEVAEDRDLLAQISSAVASITGAKGVAASRKVAGLPDDEAEQHAVTEKSSDVVLGLLASRRAVPEPHAGETRDEDAELWSESETHEGCNLFGYIDVSRAPGTLHFAPHSARHSFDFTAVNTTHHVDHLSFGLELTARERRRLPAEVLKQLTTLDGYSFIATEPHETQEHHVNIMPTSYGKRGAASPIETYQFTATSHGRTRDTLPSVLVSYDVSPVKAHVVETSEAASDFLVSLCAIIGGAVSVFGIVDGLLYASTNGVKRAIGHTF